MYVFSFLHLTGSERCQLLVLQVDPNLRLAGMFDCSCPLFVAGMFECCNNLHYAVHFLLFVICWKLGNAIAGL